MREKYLSIFLLVTAAILISWIFVSEKNQNSFGRNARPYLAEPDYVPAQIGKLTDEEQKVREEEDKLGKVTKIVIGNNAILTKDDKFVYYGLYNFIVDADPQSFQRVSLDEEYTKDKSKVYYFSRDLPEKLYILPSVDSASIIYLDDGYMRDENSVYYRGREMVGVDMSTFEHIGIQYSRYAKDKKNLYYEGEVLSNIDGSSVEVLTREFSLHRYIKDKDAVYFHAFNDGKYTLNKLDGADPSSFKQLYRGYGADNQSVYFGSRKLDGVNPKKFVSVSFDSHDFPTYTKDDRRVYFEGEIIDGVDPASFQPADNIAEVGGVFAEDKDFAYNEGRQIDKKDLLFLRDHQIILGVKKLGGNYVAFKGIVYYLEPASGADPSFLYEMKDVDRDSFKVVSLGHARDKNHSYLYANIEDEIKN